MGVVSGCGGGVWCVVSGCWVVCGVCGGWCVVSGWWLVVVSGCVVCCGCCGGGVWCA